MIPNEVHFRLTQAQHPAGTALPVQNENFTYDPVGNRLADARIGGYTYDAANELTANSSFTYTYDQDGNQITKTDASNNQTTYSYDSQNEMIGVSTAGVNWTYQYDGIGRLVSKSSGTAAGQAVFYVYAGGRLLTILDNSSNALAVFITGPYYSEPLVIHSARGDYFIERDGNQNVRIIMDANANLFETYEYSVFGQPLIRDTTGDALVASQIANPVTFSGMRWNSEAGLFLNGNRYFDPTIGRFLKPDASAFVANYRYAANNPATNIDVNGERSLNSQETAFVQNTINALNSADANLNTTEFAAAAKALQNALNAGNISTGFAPLTSAYYAYLCSPKGTAGATGLGSMYISESTLGLATSQNSADSANLEALLAHEAVHYYNGPNEAVAYQLQYDFLNAIGQTALANQLANQRPQYITPTSQ